MTLITAPKHAPTGLMRETCRLLGWLYLARGQASQAKILLAVGDRAERRDMYELAEERFLKCGAVQLAENLRRRRDQFLG